MTNNDKAINLLDELRNEVGDLDISSNEVGMLQAHVNNIQQLLIESSNQTMPKVFDKWVNEYINLNEEQAQYRLINEFIVVKKFGRGKLERSLNGWINENPQNFVNGLDAIINSYEVEKWAREE